MTLKKMPTNEKTSYQNLLKQLNKQIFLIMTLKKVTANEEKNKLSKSVSTIQINK